MNDVQLFRIGLEHYAVWENDSDRFFTTVSDVVRCLLIAEEKGCIPKIGNAWKKVWEESGPRQDLKNEEPLLPLESETEQCFPCQCEYCCGDYAFVFRDPRDSSHHVHLALEDIIDCARDLEKITFIPKLGKKFWREIRESRNPRIGVGSLIKCLLTAEKEGRIPEIPEKWKKRAAARLQDPAPEDSPYFELMPEYDQCFPCDCEFCEGDYAFIFRKSSYPAHFPLQYILALAKRYEQNGRIPMIGSQFWKAIPDRYRSEEGFLYIAE